MFKNDELVFIIGTYALHLCSKYLKIIASDVNLFILFYRCHNNVWTLIQVKVSVAYSKMQCWKSVFECEKKNKTKKGGLSALY